ncbi:MAG TPA: hypothetical protein VIR30_13345 [Nocardioides sp.]
MPNRFRAAALSVVLLLLGLFLSPQVAAEEDPTWPGLPKLREPTDGGALWLGLSVSGAQEIAMAKQWFQIPKTIIAAQSLVSSDPVNQVMENFAYVVSPEGAPAPYGYFAPIRVRTVAFGVIPASFTVHLSQPRDAEDLPMPLYSKTDQTVLPGYVFKFEDSTITGELQARISDMTVDGVPIPLGENCRTAENIEVVLDGRGYTSEMPPNPIHPEPELNTWHTSEFYTSINGGKMVGNTSMPEFVGCGAGAEDLSALISGMSSSPENKTIQRQSGTMSCWGWYLFYPCDDHEVPLPTRP